MSKRRFDCMGCERAHAESAELRAENAALKRQAALLRRVRRMLDAAERSGGFMEAVGDVLNLLDERGIGARQLPRRAR